MKNQIIQRSSFLLLMLGLVAGCSKPAFDYVGVPGFPNVPLGERLNESFTQNKAQGEVDLLIVSDNSASMAEQQTKLSGQFSQFTEALTEIDYQIGFITTDVETNNERSKGSLLKLHGREHKILRAGTPSSEEIFRKTVVVGVNGSGNEQPLMASIMAFSKRNNENSGFFREETPLAILILSDEDENSTGSGTTAEEVVEEFKTIWGDTKKLIAFGIIVRPGDNACLAEQIADGSAAGAAFGVRASHLAELTGGAVFSICDTDYSSSLRAISQKVRNLVFSVELREIPVAHTVQVEISTGEQIGFHIEGKRIIFDRAPKQGAKLIISYNVPRQPPASAGSNKKLR